MLRQGDDKKINSAQHINNLKVKLCKGSWTIFKLRKYVNIHTLKTIYYSLIYSRLKYCIISRKGDAKTIIPVSINTQNMLLG